MRFAYADSPYLGCGIADHSCDRSCDREGCGTKTIATTALNNNNEGGEK